MPSPSDLNNRFIYHPPQDDAQVSQCAYVRAQALDLAKWITDNTVESREQALAITKLEEAVFWANAGIARHYNG